MLPVSGATASVQSGVNQHSRAPRVITPTNHSLLGHDYTVGELTCTVETPGGASSLPGYSPEK